MRTMTAKERRNPFPRTLQVSAIQNWQHVSLIRISTQYFCQASSNNSCRQRVSHIKSENEKDETHDETHWAIQCSNGTCLTDHVMCDCPILFVSIVVSRGMYLVIVPKPAACPSTICVPLAFNPAISKFVDGASNPFAEQAPATLWSLTRQVISPVAT